MSDRILIVDDEAEIADLIEVYLRNENYTIYKFYTGKEAFECINNTELDLAILDIMLPDINGFKLCQQIREQYTYPIIMLTAKDDEIDKITGLTLGADDYITKPFRPLEMVARVKAQLRRYKKYNPVFISDDAINIITHSGLIMNTLTHECTLNEKPLILTLTEFSILRILLERKGNVVSAEEIFHEICTILGMILSVSLFTSVILLVFSSSDYLNRVIGSKSGTWHLQVAYQTANDLSTYKNDGYEKEIGILQSIGFSKLTPSNDLDRHYLYIEGVDASYLDMTPVEVVEGRLPLNSSEILLSQEYADKVSLSVGDSISIEVGTRYSTGSEKNIGTDIVNYTDDEVIIDIQNRQYDVVGICSTLRSEPGPASIWYSAYTGLDAGFSKQSTYSYYFRFDDTDTIMPYYENVIQERQIPNSRNSEYLLILGIGGESGYQILIYTIGIFLTALVVFGAISLIHNSFSISIQQRIRELGILASVGTTDGQLKRMLLIEAASMCILGIPFGVLLGWLAVKSVIQIWGDTIRSLFDTTAEFQLQFPLAALLIIVVMSIGTVWISAVIPANKLKKISPIDAIRQQTEFLSARDLNVSKRVQRIFGIKGILAEKEYKAHKKKYRSVITALSMSLVFFVGTLSIAEYVDYIVTEYFPSTSSDIYLYSYPHKILIEDSGLMADIEALNNVQIDAVAHCYGVPVLLSQDTVSDFVFSSARREQLLVKDQYLAMTSIQFLEDRYFNDYLSELGIEQEAFASDNSLCAIAYDEVKVLDNSSGQTMKCNIFKTQTAQDITLQYINEVGYESTKCFKNQSLQIKVISFATALPKGLDTGNSGYGDSLHLILPESARGNVRAYFSNHFNVEKIIACAAPNHSEVFDNIKQLVDNAKLPVKVIDYAARYQGSTGIVSLIRFMAVVLVIAFVSIGLANLFNIMYESIMSRQKEFAVLQSVGMDDWELNQMLNLECVKYWSKSVLYGTIISVLINVLLYIVTLSVFDVSFSFPYIGLIVAILMIGLCIFIIKKLIMSKQKDTNIIVAIRNESI